MKRYCPSCDKEFDFNIKSMEDLKNLVCPSCGQAIDSESRKPIDNTATLKREHNIGKAISIWFTICYGFSMACAVVGMIAYVLGFNTLLYWATGLAVGFFLIKLLAGYDRIRWGFILFPIAVGLCYYKLGTIEGACFGLCAMFAVRFVFRRLFYNFFRTLFRLGR